MRVLAEWLREQIQHSEDNAEAWERQGNSSKASFFRGEASAYEAVIERVNPDWTRES